MNIQIFGSKKDSDTRKAQRFFKERGVRFQDIDIREKPMSKGEFSSVKQAVGGIEKMIDPKAKDKDLLALLTVLSPSDKEEKVLEHQELLLLPIVRNGKEATVGYAPETWKKWE
jgi:arsenate reductase-like glutaredoxin family protein